MTEDPTGPDRDDTPRRLTGRYRLDEEIGRGGAGRVYRAYDERLDRSVAVKVLTDLTDTAVDRFRREAAVAARIRHPNVVTLHDAGVDGTPYLVMSLVEGPSLADRVATEGPLPVPALHRLARDLFAALDATHRAGVLHRDLTPRNVLFDRDGSAQLCDFGIARGQDDPTLTAAHTVMGTRPFVAPERLKGQPASPASDVWAVGVTLRHAATGSHDGELPADHPLASLVAACTAIDPDQRPSGADAAAAHLTGVPLDGADLPETEAMPVEDLGTPAVSPPVLRGPTAPTAPRDGDRDQEPVRVVTTGGHRTRVRPLAVLAVLAALAVAAVLASSAIRDGGATPDGAGDTPAADANGTGDETGPTDDGATAPTFDPTAPGESARRLADWMRQR